MSILATSVIDSVIIEKSIVESTIINDVEGANLLRPTSGWTGSEGCSTQSDTSVAVRFSRETTYPNHTGISISDSAGNTFTISGTSSTSPSTLIEYQGTWAPIAPVAGDVVTIAITGSGYTDSDGTAIANTSLDITNCLGTVILSMARTDHDLPNAMAVTLVHPVIFDGICDNVKDQFTVTVDGSAVSHTVVDVVQNPNDWKQFYILVDKFIHKDQAVLWQYDDSGSCKLTNIDGHVMDNREHHVTNVITVCDTSIGGSTGGFYHLQGNLESNCNLFKG